MIFPFGPLGLGATIAVAIFVIVFIYLVTKWAIKRTKEISKEFELESKEKRKKKDVQEDN